MTYKKGDKELGMDSYIYKTTKNEYRAYTKWEKEYAKHNKICNDFLEGLKTKYGNDLFEKERDEVKAIITPDEWSRALELTKATHGEYDNCSGDEPIELAYWRKPYGLHQFIVGNFHREKENNCVRIPLSKKAVRIILKEMRKCKNSVNCPTCQ